MTTYQKIRHYLFHQNKIVLAIAFGCAILSLLAHLESVVRASNGRVIPAIILLGAMTFAFNIPLMLLILRILERIVELIGKWKGYTILLIAFVLEGVIYSGSKVPSSPVVGLFTGAVAMAILMAIALFFIKGAKPFISENLFIKKELEEHSTDSIDSNDKYRAQIAQSKREKPARQEPELKETPASASCEVANPRKSIGKIIKWGAISACVMFAVVGFGVFKYQQLIEQTQSYLRDQSGPKVMNGYEVLSAVGLRDMPGFSGPLGKNDAARLAKELMSEEDQTYAAIESNPMILFLDSKVKQCINQMHLKRRQELKTLIEFTKTMFIENGRLERAWDSISANSQSNFECMTNFNAIYGSSTSDKTATRSEASDSPPAPVPSALAVSQSNTQTGKVESRLEERYNALHDEKPYAGWGEEDMINAVSLLAQPKTEEDRKWLKESEKFTLNLECSTGSCLIHQQEFSAAKMMREGKAKSAREALGLDTKSPSTVVPSVPPAEPQHLPNTAGTSQAVELMLSAARADNFSRDIGEQAVLRNLPRPERGDRKNAREKNSAGLSALNSGNYKVAADFFAEGVKADRSDVELLNNLAYALLMDGQFEAAKAKLMDVLGIDVGRSGAWANLGDLFAKMGNQRDAIAAYKLTYYFSRAPEKTLEFFAKRSELDVDEKVKYSSAKAIPTFSGIKPLNERP